MDAFPVLRNWNLDSKGTAQTKCSLKNILALGMDVLVRRARVPGGH